MSNARALYGPSLPGSSLESMLVKNSKYADNSLFTVEESMNPDKKINPLEPKQVEEEYKSLFEQNMNSYKKSSELWGRDDM